MRRARRLRLRTGCARLRAVRKVSEILEGCGLFADSEEASVYYVDEVLDGSGRFSYLDSTVSMRGLVEVEESRVWDAELLQEQHRRFLNGS